MMSRGSRCGVNHAFTFNGSYELPFGKGRKLLANMNGVANGVIGGWSANWILSAYSGTPITIGCANIATTAGAGCIALLTGENPYVGRVEQFLNPAAFKNPPVATAIGQTDFAPLGGQRTQVTGPAFRKLGFSVFKDFPVREKYRFQLRIESFNLTNTPAFAAPAFRNFADTRNFGRIWRHNQRRPGECVQRTHPSCFPKLKPAAQSEKHVFAPDYRVDAVAL